MEDTGDRLKERRCKPNKQAKHCWGGEKSEGCIIFIQEQQFIHPVRSIIGVERAAENEGDT